MAENKTIPTKLNIADFIAAVDHPTRRADAAVLDAMFREITGWQPRMWGPSIIGYGSYRYTYDSGRCGDFLATGFSPRKSNLSIYVMLGYADFSDILVRLGKHKVGKSCLYINKLADVDMNVFEELVLAGLKDLGTKWSVNPT